MKRLISWIVGLPVAVIFIAFAVANRRAVTVSFDPLSLDTPALAIQLPLWLVLAGGVLVGLITGWVAAWLNQGKWRKATREARSKLRDAKTRSQDLERAARPGIAAPE